MYLLSILILIGLVWGLFVGVLPLLIDTEDSAKEAIDAVGKLVALSATLGGIAFAASRFLFLSSAEAAQSYVKVTQNPMNTIKRRFEALIHRLKPYRVAIFIDDLDRCRSQYVVELLEGVQTLFRDAPVVYVMAADRRWLNACYEEAYRSLKPWVHAPGKSLGTLFLEKTFQLSTSVPAVPPRLKEAYWWSLIGLHAEAVDVRREGAKQRAEARIGDTVDEATMMRHLRDAPDPVEQQAIREQIVARLAKPEVVARTEHALKKFAPLLEPNPRAMKRLVNAYNTHRALATLSHLDLDRDRLVLWTILMLRWPRLADALTGNPEMLERLDQGGGRPVAEEIQALLNHTEVRDVISGKGITHKPLDTETVRQCALLFG